MGRTGIEVLPVDAILSGGIPRPFRSGIDGPSGCPSARLPFLSDFSEPVYDLFDMLN